MATSNWIGKLLRFDGVITQHLVLSESAEFRKALAKFISLSCDSWYWLVGLLAIWFFGREPWRERAMLTAVTIVLLVILVLGIKLLVRRRRPDGEWGQVYRALDPHSFPSGHAARALAIALLGVYFETRMVGCGVGDMGSAGGLVTYCLKVALFGGCISGLGCWGNHRDDCYNYFSLGD